MKKLMILMLLALSVALFGCGGDKETTEVKAPADDSVVAAQTPRTLALEWQRMIDEDGNVCCGSEATRMAVETARAKLAQALEASGIEVVLTKTDFTPEECVDCPERANRVLVAGRGVDFWLQAETGSSPCEGFCKQTLGEKGSCQNLMYEGQTYDVIPADLIVKAGLAAAANPATFRITGKCGGCPSAAGCPSADGCPPIKSTCDGSCGGTCPSCSGEKAACTCAGPCDGSCKVVETTTKAVDTGCPNAKTCGSKGCVVGG